MGDEEVRQAKQDKIKKPEKEKKSTAVAPAKKKKGLMEQAKEKIGEIKAPKKDEKIEKPLLEREYIVPLRKQWLKVPEYKRANKAVKALKQFIAQHMKVYDRDLRKIKIDILVNNEIRFRGMKKPPAKIKVKAIKYTDKVEVKLVDIPKHIEFELARKAKKLAEQAKKEIEKPKPEVEEKPVEETKEEKQDKKEKQKSSQEATQALEKAAAKQAKHTTIKKAPVVQRKALAK